ncbi:MAG: hypothetical protein ACRDPL_04920, partial [Propionibacteriaceae bacterium]
PAAVARGYAARPFDLDHLGDERQLCGENFPYSVKRPAQAPAGGACPPYGPGRAATMEPMRFRVQQLDNRENRFVLCVQPSASDPWRCRIVRARQLQQILDWLGFEDYRDAYEIYRQTRAAVREFGLGAGYIEYDLDREQDRGPIRFQGTLRPGYHWPPGEDAGAQ